MKIPNHLKHARECCNGSMKNCFFNVTLSIYIYCDSITVFQLGIETL